MNHARLLLRLAASLPLFAVACGAPAGEDIETSEQWKKIEPTDDENLGFVRVDAPSGVSNEVLSRTSVAYASAEGQERLTLEVGEPRRVRAGDGHVSVNTELGGTSAVTIVPAKTTTVTLAGVDLALDPSPLDVDFGPTAEVLVRRKGGSDARARATTALGLPGTYDARAVVSTVFISRESMPAGVVPLGALDAWGSTFTLNAGSITKADVTPPDVRATIVVKQPVRDFPDPQYEFPYCHTQSLVIVQRRDSAESDWSTGKVDRWQALGRLGRNEDHTIRVLPFDVSEVLHFEIVVNNIPVVLDAKPTTTTEVKLERIDVDDVTITTETGATYKVHGTYQLYRKVGASWSLVETRNKAGEPGCQNPASMTTSTSSTFPTKTGLDVPAGSYKVVVTYDTAEQAKKSKEYVVTVP